MRPTGVALIAIYHYPAAAFIAVLGVGLFVGGKVISMLGGADGVVLPKAGFLIGVVGGTALLVFALIRAIAGFGVWSMKEWGRLLAIILAVISLVFAIPGLLLSAITMHALFGGFRVLRVVISALIIWYLLQAETNAQFRASA
jgi:uncharacterized membrane protein (DUF2068 family)